MRNLFAIAATLSTVIGCGGPQTVPTKEQLDEAEKKGAYGPPPTDYAVKAREAIKARLKDPDSLKQFSAEPPEKAYIGNIQRDGMDWGLFTKYKSEFQWVWRCRAFYNAKNSFGAYVGVKPAYVYFREGQPVLVELP
jgi:hypothetical protein